MVLLVELSLLLSGVLVRGVTISNVVPKLDQNGKIIELGDGSIAKFGDRYYLYGVKYVCTPSPQGPTQGCAKTDRRIWGNMSIGVSPSSPFLLPCRRPQSSPSC